MKQVYTHFKMLKVFLLLAGFTFLGTIKGFGQCNADFTYVIDTATGNVTFTNTSTFITPTRTFLWYFGSQGSSTQANPVKNLPPGTHMVCLYVFDSICSDSTCKIIVVPQTSGGSCNANFTHSVNTSTGNVSFTNQSTGTGTGSYLWTFSGGYGSSTQANPSKVFAPGTYMVCLLASYGSCVDTICKSITVSQTCDANFTYTIDTASGTVQFNNTSSASGSATWLWYFDTAGTSTQNSPQKKLAPGIYTICLFLSDSFCFDSTCKTVIVPEPKCNAHFSYTIDANDSVHFTNTSTGSGTGSYYWNINGYTTTSANPTIILPPGIHPVCLRAQYGNCIDSFCVNIRIDSAGCKASFTYSIYPDTASSTRRIVVFNNTSTGNNLVYFWTFGIDSNTSGVQSPVYHYPVNGTYTACLVVRSLQDSCIDSTCVTFSIGPDSTTALADQDLLSGIKIYPVPFNDMIHIDMHANKAGLMDIAVFDMVGRLRMEKSTLVEFGNNKLELNLAELSHGFYTIELKIGNQRKTQRVVK